jgi:hypothetical protein
MPLDPFDPFGDPLAPRRRVSPFTTEEETSLLGNLLEGSLGGLAYLGKLADKTFGSRAVRGVLGGNTRELASVLPFSDTLGITRESDIVKGTDLLGQLGVITPGDDSIENEIAGFGAELLTDPSMFVGAAVPRAVLGATRRGSNFAARNLGSGLEAVSGVNPYTFAGRQLDKARLAANTAFDTSVAETTTQFGQDLARSTYTPKLNAGRQAVEDAFASGLTGLDEYAVRLGRDRAKLLEFNTALTGNAELPGNAADAARLAALGYNPTEVSEILAIGNKVAADTRATLGQGQKVGAVSKELFDIPKWAAEANQVALDAGQPIPFPDFFKTQYFPRSAAEWGLGGDFTRGQRDRLSGVSPFQTARREELLGVPGGINRVNELVRDPSLSGLTRTKSDLAVEGELLKMMTGHTPGVTPPPSWAGTPWGDAAWAGAQAQAREMSNFLKSLPPEAQQHGLYNMDFLGNARARRLEQARVNASAETVLEGLSPARGVVDDAANIQARGQRPVSVADILQKTGLTHVDAATGNPVALELLSNAHGNSISAMKNLAVSEDVAADMLRMGQAWKVPESVAPVVDFWDRTVALFKGSLTSPFPAFHVRNAISGMFNMWRAGVLSWDASTSMLNVLRGGRISDDVAARIFPGMAADEATLRFREMLIANNVSFTRAGQVGERVGAGAPVARGGLQPGLLPEVGAAKARPFTQDAGQFLGGYVPEKGRVAEQLNPLRTRGVLGEESAFIPAERGEKLGNTVEDWIRGSHFLGELLRGSDPAAAKLSTMKYQIDYGDLTQFEQNVMRRIFPWYTFSRKNLPPLLEDLATNPAKVTGALRFASGIREPGEFVPPYIAEGASVPIPGAEDGQRRYISSFGLPFEDEAVKTLGAVAQGDTRRVFQQLFGMAQPFVKLPAELATGTQMYSGRRLDDLRPYEFSTLGGLLPDDVARRISQVIANTPASRAGSTVDKLLDERKGLGPTLANTLTGVRVTDVDIEKVKDPIARDVLQELLRGQPGVKVREDVYVPKANLAGMSPEDLKIYDMLTEIEKRQLERARLVKAREKEAKAGR